MFNSLFHCNCQPLFFLIFFSYGTNFSFTLLEFNRSRTSKEHMCFHLEFAFVLMHLYFAVRNIWDNFRQPFKNMAVHMAEQMPGEKK